MDRSPPVCPECGYTSLKRIAGAEVWCCPDALAERRGGGKGPFKHKGLVYAVSYRLRSSPTNTLQEQAKAALTVTLTRLSDEINHMKEEGLSTDGSRAQMQLAVAKFESQWNRELPGDVIVDRDFRKVYLVDSTGARRRVDEPEAKKVAIDKVKELIEKEKNGQRA